MNPLHAKAQGYRSYDDLDFEIPLGCTVILGPNGSGKSSLVELVPLALFGSPTRSLAGYLNVEHDELTIELTFEHGGTVYRVRRWYSSKGRGKSTLDLEEQSETSEWMPRTRETAAATQALIEETLGISRETYLASAHLSQGDGDRFTTAEPSNRKRLLAEILQLDLWDDSRPGKQSTTKSLLGLAQRDLRAVETELAGSAAMTARLEQTVAEHVSVRAEASYARRQRDGAAELVADAEKQLEQAQTQQAIVAARNERLLHLGAEVAAARQEYGRLHEQLGQAHAAAAALDDCRVELDEVAADAARIPDLEAMLADLIQSAQAVLDARRRRDELAAQIEQRDLARGRLVDQALALRGDANAARAKAQHLDDHIGEASSCDRCGQTLGVEAAARAAGSYCDEATGLDQRAAQIDTQASADLEAIAGLHEQFAAIEIPPAADDPQPIELQLAAARAAATKQGQLAERISHLEQLAATRTGLAEQAAAAGATLDAKQSAIDAENIDAGDLGAAERAVDIARGTVRDTRAALEQRAAEFARAEQRLEQIVAAQSELDQLRAQTADLHGRVDLLKLAERAYGRDGIPALIVENAAIPQIETEANRILGELGGATADCRIELRTQRELKSSTELRETLDIVIRTPAGDRPYETFSGGERTRLNLALRIGLARLLAHRRGAESRLLAIDEPEFLDEQGVARLADVLRGLTGDFDRIMLVSHHPGLAGSFDQTIEVRRDGGGGSIIDAGAREAVTA